MADLFHIYGQDVGLSATGGLSLASGTQQGQQKVLRRLLTNPGDDLHSLDYGAGLPAFIGSPASADRMRAVVLKQMRLEKYVDQTVSPSVSVEKNAATGVTNVLVQYVDAQTAQTSQLNVPVRPNV